MSILRDVSRVVALCCLMILETYGHKTYQATCRELFDSRSSAWLVAGETKGIWYWDCYVTFVHYRSEVLFATLHLSFDRDGLQIEHIQLVSTEPTHGGIRWWFVCPNCDRRVARLHLSTQKCFRFFCRLCHQLSYESVQSSRKKSERFLKLIARDWYEAGRGL